MQEDSQMPPRKPTTEPDEEATVTEAAPVVAKVKITRQTKTAWWCPVCDNSQPLDEDTCAKCGWKR